MHKTFLLTAAFLAVTPLVRAADVLDTSAWAKFSAFSYSGKTATVPKDGEYLNPIVAGFYPDPSFCRVGADYYLVNSSFQYFPGIPIWHSTDLVNWTQIGNVIDGPSQYPMRGGQMSSGEYAPTIRYHDGMFYVVCTLVGGPGNFYVTAKDPKGPWSDPVFLPTTGGMDPSFFFDDDGKCYICNCDEPKGPAQYSGHRTIRLQEVDLKQGKVVGEQTVLVNGGTDISKHPVWCEGPHLYKIKGKYYLMCAQGGTSTEHSEVIFRSDSLRGPYVPWEKNPILTAVDLPPDRPNPVTCTGHADLLETQNGEWFAVFLGCQPYEKSFFNTGRQTFMLPVTWTEDGWPLILPPKTPVPLSIKLPKLSVGKPGPVLTTGDIAFKDDFASRTLDLKWIGIRSPSTNAAWNVTQIHTKRRVGSVSDSFRDVPISNAALLLEPRADRLSGQGNPSYLGVRQQNNDFSCQVTLSAQPKTANCVAGLAAFQNETHYYAIDVKMEDGVLKEICIEQPAAGARGMGRRGGSTPPNYLAVQKLPENLRSIDLQIEMAGPVMKCSYRTGAGVFTQVGQDLPSSFLSTDTAGGFQGVTLGMFARTPDAPASAAPAPANP